MGQDNLSGEYIFHMCRRNEMKMQRPLLWLICALVFQCVRANNNVGCLFSPTLCEDKEECFDDNAFGRCQFPYSSDLDTYRHLLSSETTKLLERELTRLFAGGYRWRHQYTQCVVQNILYTSRHRISYDPGLCSRVMQFTLPDVPPEVLSKLESPDPDQLAYIKFKPNRDDPESAMFADEIFNPPVDTEKNIEVKETRKRSAGFDDSDYASNDWIRRYRDEDYDKENDKPDEMDKESLFGRLLEAADDTGKLFQQLQNNANDRYPDNDVPIVRTELSSDLNQRPAFTEGGTEWLPVNEDDDYLTENDIIDPYEKKRIREPHAAMPDTNDIIHLEELPYDDHDSPSKDDTIELIEEKPHYENFPPDDEDKNFRWNYKHINRGIDDDLTRFSRGRTEGSPRSLQPSEDKNINGN